MRITLSAIFSCIGLCGAALCGGAVAAAPAEKAGSAGAAKGVLAEIVVQGNERTADSVVIHAVEVEVELGERVDSTTLRRVKQRVENLRLFENIEVSQERSGEGVRLVIRVEERWTLIPVPFFSASGSGYEGGAFLLETNLFGYGKTLALGGLYSTQGATLLGYYEDPALGNTDFTLDAIVSYADQVRRRFDGPTQTFAYRDTRYTFDVSPGYRFTPTLRVSLGYFGDLTSTAAEGAYAAPVEGGDLHGVVTALNIDAYDFRWYFNDGLQAEFKLRGARDELGSDRDFSQVNLEATYQTGVVSDHALTFELQYMTVRGQAPIDQFVEGGGIGTRGFETEGLWLDTLAAGTLDYQIPFFKPSWGTWTLGAHTDFGVADEGGESKPQGYVSPGVGLRLYLKQVALPALGVDVTWSVADERPLVTAFFGASF